MERDVLNPASSEPGGVVELWASRALNLAWLPRCDNWHNPSLLSASVPEAVLTANPVPLKSDQRPVWFWRVEPTFGAWVVRAIHRASERQKTLTEAQCAALLMIREAIVDAHPDDPGVWEKVEARARSPGFERVHAEILPGIGILREVASMAHFGMAPKWEGYEKDVERMEKREAEAAASAVAVAEPSATLTNGPEPAVATATAARAAATVRRPQRPSRDQGPQLF